MALDCCQSRSSTRNSAHSAASSALEYERSACAVVGRSANWQLAVACRRSCTGRRQDTLSDSRPNLRLADALGLRVDIDLVDLRRSKGPTRSGDPVHAAMTEWFARRLSPHAFSVAIDEPYQHYQFGGRADLVAWTLDPPELLHIENRTEFPNIQEAIGSYNAKRRYLPAAIAERLGLRGGFRTVTNAMAVLWSADALHVLRLRSATFAATYGDEAANLESWLEGTPPAEPGATSTLVVIDPTATGRARSVIGLPEFATARPRFRGYADALAAFKTAGLG